MSESPESTEEQVERLTKRTHILLAGRMLRSGQIPNALVEYGAVLESGLETLAKILDDLSKAGKLKITIEPEQVGPDEYDIWQEYYLIEDDGTETPLPELGRVNLEDIFGSSLI